MDEDLRERRRRSRMNEELMDALRASFIFFAVAGSIWVVVVHRD